MHNSTLEEHDIVSNHAAKVFLFEQPSNDSIDISSAAKFGRIQYIFKPVPREKSRSSIWETEALGREIAEALLHRNFDPARDYLCISGHQISVAIMLATAITEYGLVKVLFFDTKDRVYVPRTLGREFVD